jgi:hypothetical protein
MMKISAILVLSALLQDDPVAAAALKGFSHPWADFRVGSTVTYKETSRRPEVDGAGNLVLKDVVTQVVWSMASTDGEKAVLRIQSEGQDSEVPYHLALPNWTKGKGERKADEEVQVGGTKFMCKVTTISVDADKDASEVTTIWQNPEAPGWAVKVRNETFVRGKTNTSEEAVLVGLQETVKVGDREVPCRLVQVTTEVDNGGRVVKKEWRSDEVPGGILRKETRHYQRGREIEAAFSKMEVVRFNGRK